MKIINDLSEYIAYVNELPNEYSISRGQSKDYKLLPTSLRLDENENRIYTRRDISQFLQQFKVDSYQYLENPENIKNDFEWMLYAQHYGLPTKLLDFTTSHINSMLFAVENAFSSEEPDDAFIYFLNPEKLNLTNYNQSQIISLTDIRSSDLENANGPIIVKGRKINPRINAQRGLFALFNNDDNAIDSDLGEEIFKKIKIPGGSTKDILSSLFSMGITFTTIYPELESITKDIKMKQDILNYIREE